MDSTKMVFGAILNQQNKPLILDYFSFPQELDPKLVVVEMKAAGICGKQLDEKIKKSDYQSIELVENADILKSLLSKKKKQIIVAFAAETSHDRGSALAKLESKGADILYLNDISAGDIFNSETTYGEIFKRDGTSIKVAKTTKDTLARELLDTALIQLG